MLLTALYRLLLTTLILTLLLLTVGCDQSGPQATSPAERSGVTPTGKQTGWLDPAGDRGAIHYSNLVEKLRPLATPRRSYRLGVIMKFSGNPYYQRLADGMHAKASALGVSIYFQAGLTESDQEGQRSALEEAVNKGYDALLISPQTDTNLLSTAKTARTKGILLINVDDALLGVADYYIGPDHYESGVLAANYFIDTFDQGGKVAVIQGHDGDYGVEQRTKGFADTLIGKSFRIVARPFCLWDLQIALQSASAILSNHADLKGFYCSNDTMALGVARAVRQAGRAGEVLVVGRDGIKPVYAAIRNKELAATVDVDPFVLGERAVELTVRILEGQDINRVVFTAQRLISLEDLDLK